MRADSFTFNDVFQVDSLSGRISLGADRHIVLDTAAMGAMRHELMDNLGWDVSRGIFVRAGYQSGRHDARQLRKHHPLPSDQDLLMAGLRLGYLEGMANARLDQFEVDRSSGKIHIKGEWLDSFEVEYHLQQYGIGSRSACWTLEGYGSGFASEFLGMDVLCFETHCRAKGDSACKFEFRSAADWGEAARPALDMLAASRFTERFDRCLRIIGDMGCELEQTSLDPVFTTDANGFVTSCSQGGSAGAREQGGSGSMYSRRRMALRVDGAP